MTVFSGAETLFESAPGLFPWARAVCFTCFGRMPRYWKATINGRSPAQPILPMGKQYNKVIKRKRRMAYVERKEAAKAAAAASCGQAVKAAKPAAAKPKAPAKPKTPKTVSASTPAPEPAPQISESQMPQPAV